MKNERVKKMERKCVIYNRLSTENKARIEELKGQLIEYCTNNLKIEDYDYFEEVGSVLNERKVFNEIMKRIYDGRYTDFLVYHKDRIYKPTYDLNEFERIINDIKNHDVDLHSIM